MTPKLLVVFSYLILAVGGPDGVPPVVTGDEFARERLPRLDRLAGAVVHSEYHLTAENKTSSEKSENSIKFSNKSPQIAIQNSRSRRKAQRAQQNVLHSEVLPGKRDALHG